MHHSLVYPHTSGSVNFFPFPEDREEELMSLLMSAMGIKRLCKMSAGKVTCFGILVESEGQMSP